MIALVVLIMCGHISARWEVLVETAWAALTIIGMSIWVWANWSALCDEEREQRTRRLQNLSGADQFPARDLPLTPVQRRFLDAMRRQKRV